MALNPRLSALCAFGFGSGHSPLCFPDQVGVVQPEVLAVE